MHANNLLNMHIRESYTPQKNPV